MSNNAETSLEMVSLIQDEPQSQTNENIDSQNETQAAEASGDISESATEAEPQPQSPVSRMMQNISDTVLQRQSSYQPVLYIQPPPNVDISRIGLRDELRSDVVETVQRESHGFMQRLFSGIRRPTRDSSRPQSYQSLPQHSPPLIESSAVPQRVSETSRSGVSYIPLELGSPPTYDSIYGPGVLRPIENRENSESSLPSYRSRMSIDYPIGPCDVLAVCNIVRNVTRNISAALPEINEIIEFILSTRHDSRKWSKTKTRVTSLAVKLDKVSSKVEDLHNKAKDMTMTDWSQYKGTILTSARALIPKCESLSYKLNELKKDLSNPGCLHRTSERTRAASTLEVLILDLDRVKERVKLVSSISSDVPCYRLRIAREACRRWCKFCRKYICGRKCFVFLCYGFLIGLMCLLLDTSISHSKLLDSRGVPMF
ncbi:hypothetical protein C0J52_08513 [Blattella germanica]|nr:hypothetical protein C0J52_08513 [Blattella germanica]